MPWALLLSGADLSSSAGVQMRGRWLSHSGLQECTTEAFLRTPPLPGWRAEAPHSTCRLWCAGGTACVEAGEGVSCLIHRRVFLAIHPFSKHRNAPITSAAPVCVAQWGRVASHHLAERCSPALSPSEVPVPSLQGSRRCQP